MAHLLFAAAAAGVEGGFERARDVVGVEDYAPVNMACGASRRLDKACCAAQKALLVGVENADKRHFGNVDSLAQKVDTHEGVGLSQAQTPQNFDALDCVDVAVQVLYLDAVFAQIVRNFLAHALCEGCDENALAALGSSLDFGGAVLHLPLNRADNHFGVEQPRRAVDLLYDGVAYGKLEGCGGCGDENRLPR